jgi:hypothetical protein
VTLVHKGLPGVVADGRVDRTVRMDSNQGAVVTTAEVKPTLQPGAERPDVERTEKRLPHLAIGEAALALRKAWAVYLLMAGMPPAAMIGAIFFLIFFGDAVGTGGGLRASIGLWWLVAGMIFIGVTVPLGFYLRDKAWSEFRHGGVVRPDRYLRGWMPIWGPLVIAGVMGFVGLAVTGEVATVFVSLLALVVFLSMSPNGHGLTRPVGDHDDPGVYEEPK